MCNDNKGPTLRIFVGEMDLMPSARAVVTRSRTTKYMMDTSFEVAMAFCWCPTMPPTASHKIETTVLVTKPQLIVTLNHSLCLKMLSNAKHKMLCYVCYECYVCYTCSCAVYAYKPTKNLDNIFNNFTWYMIFFDAWSHLICPCDLIANKIDIYYKVGYYEVQASTDLHSWFDHNVDRIWFYKWFMQCCWL